jgi:hypothetical protein
LDNVAGAVSILPSHRYGESKYATVGMKSALGALRESREAWIENREA